MIGRLNHVAIAVPDLEAAAGVYRAMLGAEVSAAIDQPKHGVKVIFVNLPNTKIELLHPLGAGSPIAGFLERNPAGARVLGDGEPKIGAHDKPVLFLHPKDFCGTLIELEQA